MNHRWIRPSTLIALLLVSACSGAPQKSEREILEQAPETETIPDSATLMEEMKEVEAMPSAESFGNAEVEEAPGDAPVSIDASIEALINDAVAAAEKGDLDGAASDLQDLVSDPGGGYLAAYNLGVVRERQGKYEKAANRYFEALQKNVDFSPALSNLIRLYLRAGRIGDAERIGSRFVNSRPENVGHRAAFLLVSIAKGAFEDVTRGAKSVLRKDERNVDAMYALAQANFELERYELSRAVIQRAVELAPNRADLFNFYGMIQLKLNDKPSAIANFRKAVELRSQFPEARNNLGVLYHEARDYESAAREFIDAVRSYPDYKEAYLNLGNAYKGMARYKDSELAFKRALQLDPSYADAHFNLGVLYLDSDIPGMDPIARLQKAVDELNTYKGHAKTRPKGDPADKYIEEARKAIEVERQKAQMMREAQMSSGSGSDEQ